MFGRPDIGLPANAEGGSDSSHTAKTEGPINSFTSVFSPPKLEITEPKMETPAGVPAPKAAPAETKQAVPAAKTQGPPIMLLAIVLLVIMIVAAAALYLFVIRK
jgi:hypothetical protein